MPLILGTNSIKDTGFNVANSLRFNSGSSDYLNRTLSGSGNTKKFSISFWQKLGTGFDADRSVISGGADSNNYLVVRNQSTQVIQILETASGSDHTNLVTNRLFRDVSAWYHIVVAVDTTQGTDTNRVKLYVNGTQETSFSTATYPGQNDDLQFNNNTAHAIGRRQPQANIYMDGYLAEFVFVDNQQLDATSFGEFDEDTGIWKPKNVSGLTFGTNGFYLDFEDSSALGNDANGSNNFTVNNLTAIDQSTDTCTNNFATLNPLIPIGGTFSEGNLQHTRSSAGYRSAVSSIGVSSGKWYVEIKSPDSGNIGVGVINGDNSSGLYMSGSEQFLGQHSYDVGYYFNGVLYVGNSSQSGSWTSYTSNDIIGIAIDVDNGFVYFSKNGTFVNSGDPTSGATGTGGYNLSGIGSNGTYFIGCSTGNNSEHYVNFGNPIFSISSGNSDGNGYGNFEYAVPSGYYSLNTKNLAEYG